MTKNKKYRIVKEVRSGEVKYYTEYKSLLFGWCRYKPLYRGKGSSPYVYFKNYSQAVDFIDWASTANDREELKNSLKENDSTEIVYLKE